ncbi:AGAP013133-PA [Anopheles gambiae str. PEST]|uniref:AGAP013133-PA n=1 Tax=Anopheles gambiae TaxID=7165 RepID=F5HJB7_ANOGA|nr:AGAP013133-PA [Anopheles gambiae str. PEST]
MGRLSALFSRKKLTSAKTRLLVDQLKTSCGVFLDPTIRSPNIQEARALKILRQIVTRSQRHIVQYIPERDAILECSLILVQNYVAHLRLRPSPLKRFRQEPFADAKVLFQAAIDLLVPEMLDEVIDTTLKFLQTENLWQVEFICVEILMFVLECRSPSAPLLSKLIDRIERFLALSDIGQVRHMLSVLQIVIVSQRWDLMEYSELSKLVRFYHSSVMIGTSRNQIYELRRGFEKCLKNLIPRLSIGDLYSFFVMMLPLVFDTDMSDEARIEFGSTVEHAASTMTVYDPRNRMHTAQVSTFIVEYLLRCIASEDPTRSILACKVLTKLLERGQHNPNQFQSPTIFHMDTYYEIVLATDFAPLQELLVEQRVHLEQALLLAIERHSQRKMNVEVFYQLLCTLLVEAPSGFTASAVSCLLLKVQKMFLNYPTDPDSSMLADQQQQQHNNRIHATIMAVMTLINWIHRSGSMNAYITQVLHNRFDHAPSLNPPLRERYRYAPHHVSWYERRLFFDSLEIRYCLWKCFRISEEKIPKPARMRTRSYNDPRRRLDGGTLNVFAGM